MKSRQRPQFCNFTARESSPASMLHENSKNLPPSRNLTYPLSVSNKFCGHQGSNQIILEGFNSGFKKPHRNPPDRSRAMTENRSDHRIFRFHQNCCFDTQLKIRLLGRTLTQIIPSLQAISFRQRRRRKALKSRQRPNFAIYTT